MRSEVGSSDSEDDCAGVAEAEQAEELAAAVTVTEVKVDKVLILELLLTLVGRHSRTSRQLRQTADHPEGGQ